jgi:DNA-directed RNA polymerase specialized sigma24 family protein
MLAHSPDTDALLQQAGQGDAAARQQLLARHRDRLRRMVAVRLDPRLAARIDPSDVVQEALWDAAGRLSDYLRDRPVPFYPWLRRLAWEHLVKLHERHLQARKRSVLREEPYAPDLPDRSALLLAQRLAQYGHALAEVIHDLRHPSDPAATVPASAAALVPPSPPLRRRQDVISSEGRPRGASAPVIWGGAG